MTVFSVQLEWNIFFMFNFNETFSFCSTLMEHFFRVQIYFFFLWLKIQISDISICSQLKCSFEGYSFDRQTNPILWIPYTSVTYLHIFLLIRTDSSLNIVQNGVFIIKCSRISFIPFSSLFFSLLPVDFMGGDAKCVQHKIVLPMYVSQKTSPTSTSYTMIANKPN